jgi:hypothetical protein
MRTALVSLILLATSLGCSSGQPNPRSEVPPAASAGDEFTPETPVAAPANEEAPRADEAAPVRASGPATLTLVALVAGKTAAATVRVLDERGERQAEASSGMPITLPAGNYKLEVAITDAAIMADKPTQQRELRLEPGQTLQVEANMAWAKVQLDVRVNGRSQPGARVQLLRAGEVVAEMKSGAAPVPISPGRYEADVLLKGAKIHVTGLQFPEAATQTVPVNVRL